MNKDYNNWHPMPRYGLTASLIYLNKKPKVSFKDEELAEILIQVLKESLNHFMLEPHPRQGSVQYKYLSGINVDPGKKSGQIAANGFYTAPHIITSNNAAGIVKETKNIISKLEMHNYSKSYELKRSFAPMIAKINAGRASMSNPRVDLLRAAYTAYATLTNLKPAAYINGNTGLIPDLPFYDKETGSFPMFNFIKVFKKLQRRGVGEDAMNIKYDGKTYYRPPIFKGNYNEAPRSMELGAIPLIASIGKWVEKKRINKEEAIDTLQWLENRPIYIISDTKISQELFGHHLVSLAIDGELHLFLKHLSRVSLIGIEENKKFRDNTWQLFIKHFDQFLKFFTRSSFQNFLAYRATYPIEFFTLLKTYFMNALNYSESLINAAIIYGQTLNRAAYIYAKNEDDDDKRKGRSSRGIKENKHRVLLQLESIVQSAKSNAELISRLNTQVGRLTMQDIPAEVQPFLVAAINNEISLEDTKHLITAFMRLSTFKSSENSFKTHKEEDASSIDVLGE